MQLTANKSLRSFRPAALAVMLVFLAGASAVHAAKPLGINLPADSILTQVEKIHQEAKAGTRGWDNVSAEKKTQFTAARDRVVALLNGKKSAAQLEEAQRIELGTALTTINTLAKEADDERMVCTREKKVGEFRPTETCMTVAERRRLRESAQKGHDQRQASQTDPKIQ